MVGTSVRERKYDAASRTPPPCASGVNRYLAAPVSSSTGTNTMQMASVETKAGSRDLLRAVENRPRQRLSHRQVAVDVLDFHRRVVHQNADRQRQAAQRHHVDGLAQQLRARSATSESTSGIEMQTISVLRQLPRNSRIISPVSTAAISASRSTPLIAARTKTD